MAKNRSGDGRLPKQENAVQARILEAEDEGREVEDARTFVRCGDVGELRG
jgi:hypothetical protein